MACAAFILSCSWYFASLRSRRAAAFEVENRRQFDLMMRTYLAQLLPGPVIEAIAAVGVGLAIAYGGQRVFSGDLLPGELIAFLVAMGLLNMPLKSLSEINSLTQRALAGAERAFAVLDTPPRLEDGGEIGRAHV